MDKVASYIQLTFNKHVVGSVNNDEAREFYELMTNLKNPLIILRKILGLTPHLMLLEHGKGLTKILISLKRFLTLRL